MKDNMTARAYEFAKAAHGSINQLRKYSDEPYIVHPEEVCRILEKAGETDQEILAAAMLHDVIEDVFPHKPEYGPLQIKELFGDRVLEMVYDLTDVFTHENFPTINRSDRKDLQAVIISKINDDSLKIKLADMIHNTSDIAQNDPGFSVVYFEEMRKVVDLLTPRMRTSDNSILLTLWHKAKTQIDYYESKWKGGQS